MLKIKKAFYVCAALPLIVMPICMTSLSSHQSKNITLEIKEEQKIDITEESKKALKKYY